MGNTNSASDISGKRIFFLYPTMSVQNQIITELVQQEYEVYIIKDHIRLVKVLKKCTDSVLFINIDEKMSKQEWEKWISGTLSAMPELKVGIFTSDTSDELREKYTGSFSVPYGFMGLRLDMNVHINKILETLNDLNVKGRRKYLRASINKETTATMNMPFGGVIVNGVIKDISVVGISCVFDHDPELTKNALFRDIQIRLQTMLLKVEAIVFGSRLVDNEKTYVMLFTHRIDPDVRIKIRKYIQINLQSKMDMELK